MPLRLRYANSASASPGACVIGSRRQLIAKVLSTRFFDAHCPPLETKSFHNPLEILLDGVNSAIYTMATLDRRAMGSVEDKESAYTSPGQPDNAMEHVPQGRIGCMS